MQKVIIQYAFFCLYLNCSCTWSAKFRCPIDLACQERFEPATIGLFALFMKNFEIQLLKCFVVLNDID
jgi:hypothetical protein